jgi:hypothetical protein
LRHKADLIFFNGLQTPAVAKMTHFVSQNAECSRLNPRLQTHSHDDRRGYRKTVTQMGTLSCESLLQADVVGTNEVNKLKTIVYRSWHVLPSGTRTKDPCAQPKKAKPVRIQTV